MNRTLQKVGQMKSMTLDDDLAMTASLSNFPSFPVILKENVAQKISKWGLTKLRGGTLLEQ